ncbi:MAG: hypothetical protein RIB84_26540 [Sneathiellaceae bacterium]
MSANSQMAGDRHHGTGDPRQPTYPAEAARQGHIVLRSRARRRVFVAGLVGLVFLLLALLAMDLFITLA